MYEFASTSLPSFVEQDFGKSVLVTLSYIVLIEHGIFTHLDWFFEYLGFLVYADSF